MLKEFKTVLPYIKKKIHYYLLGLFFLFLTNLSQLALPLAISSLINLLVYQSPSSEELLIPIAYLLGLGILISFGRWGWRFFIIGVSRKIEASLREQLFQKWTLLGQSYFNTRKTGDLMALATNDLQAVRMATGFATVGLVDASFMAVSILIILFTQYPSIALYTVLPLPLISLVILFLGSLVGQRFKIVQQEFSRLSAHVQEALSGIKIIQAFVQERSNQNRFESLNKDYMGANMKLIRLWGLFFPVVGLLSGVSTFMLLLLGGPQVISGQLDPGDFSALLLYLGMLVWPMISVGFTYNMLQRGAASMSRVNETLHTPIDIPNLALVKEKPENFDLEVRNLNFHFPEDNTPILKDMSFQLPQGQLLGVLGPTGSGKSTLTELLCRFLDPPEGTIFIGGQDIREFDLPLLRRQYALVPQNPFLFSMTIKENIAFGAEHTSDEDLWALAELSTITRDLDSFPAGWNTLVGEKGVTLSGGQKQRLTLARALAANHPILILDDSLSAVDLETEEKILRHLKKTRKGLSTLLISHRTATLQKCDSIVVIEDGRITAQGTHDQLIKQGGFYKQIKALQDLATGVGHEA